MALAGRDINHHIGFLSLIYDLVTRQDSWLVAYGYELSIDAKLIKADPKLFSGKHKNNIEGEQAASLCHEDVPSSSQATSASFLSSSMKVKILN